jgi:phosphoribosylformylglycinamidine synthase
MSARVAVIRFPGSNCENESLRAVERCGLRGAIIRWNAPAAVLAAFDAYILPGGFSYQDRIRAGAVGARLPLMDVVAKRAEAGAPVLGICNGAQILIEAGLVGPEAAEGDGPTTGAALTHNRIPRRDGYYTRWVFLAPGPAAPSCVFTRGLDEALPMPMAHGEGRFRVAQPAQEEAFGRHVALAYANAAGAVAAGFPDNPNGSLLAAAGLANARGNILALMPHPERAQILAQVPEDLAGRWGRARRGEETAPPERGRHGPTGPPDLESPGPGLVLFEALATHFGVEVRR